jgi:hypothetical protein
MATVSYGRRLKAAVSGWLVPFALAILHSTACAVEMPSLYTVEVPLQTDRSDAQTLAYEAALSAVLVRITGAESAAGDEDLLGLFPTPARYVLQYRREGDTLIVSLDGPAIEALLRRAGAPIWSNDRPLTLVWLAVDRGLGDREIVAAGDPEDAGAFPADRNAGLREQVLLAAQRRGIPVLFPLLDTEDLEAISFSDIWGGFNDALIDASRRYGSASILVGRVRTEDMFGNRWSYYYGNQQLNWTGTPDMVVNLLADALADRFAISGNERVDEVVLTISGVDSVSAYGSVQRLLAGVSAIESFRIDTVAGDEIRYIVRVQGGTDRLATALEFSGVLRRPDWLGAGDYFGAEPGNSLDYVYQQDPAAYDADDGDGVIRAVPPGSPAGSN